MATVTLQGAHSYHYSGTVFWKGDPTAVDDALARALENFPEYFDVVYDGNGPKAADKAKADARAKARTGAGASARTRAGAAPVEPRAVEI